jgi:hypothetical protein
MTAATNKNDQETAVRQYLLFLEDPTKLRDDAEIQKRTQAVLDAKDPIDKLKALAELERVAKIDEGPLREGFIKHAKAWSEEVSVPLSAFRELRVSDDVLREAGFDVPATRGRGRGRASSEGRQRAKAVPVEEIKNYVLGLKGTFILTDVMNGVGGSQATVRKAIDELIEAGQVEKLGPMPNYSGRGRAPVQYSRS